MTKVIPILTIQILGALFSTLVQATQAPPHLAAVQWGINETGLPVELSDVRAVALARTNALTVDPEGRVHLWSTHSPPPPALMVPSGLSNVVDVAITESFAAALKSDGTVTCWGAIDGLPVPEGLTNVTQIAAGDTHMVVVTTGGEVFAWGNNDYGQASVPPDLSNVVAVAADLVYSIVLRSDGHIVAFGGKGPDQFALLQTETNAVAIATGPIQMNLLRRDGTVASLALDWEFQGLIDVPPNLTNVLAVAAGDWHNFALDANGTVTSWGAFWTPDAVHDAAAIFASKKLAMAWVKYPVIGEFPTNIFAAPGQTIEFAVSVHGEPPLQCLWRLNGTPIEGATQSTLVLTNVNALDIGLYSLTVSNAYGVATSPAILLSIGPPTLLTHPEGTVATVGSTVTLVVEAAGLDPLSYSWLCNGTPVEGAFSNTLVLSGVQFTNTGNYQAVVTNPYGAVTSSVAHVEVSILDQQQTTAGGWAHLQRDWDRCSLAQTFTPSESGRLVQLSLSGDYGGLEQEFPTTVSVFDTDDGRPGTNLLGRVVISSLADSHSIQFDHRPVYLVAGTEYAFVLWTEAPAYGYQNFKFQCGLYNPYPGGRTWQKVGAGPWLDLAYPSPTADLVFSTYMVPGIPPVRLTSPAEGSIIRLGESTLVAALASELQAAPFTLGIHADGNPLGFSANSPFQVSWSPITTGESELFATLTVGAGQTLTSQVVRVTVVASSPGNDRFADRIVLTNDYHVVTASNSGGTSDPDEAPVPSGLGASVWWQWTAPRSGETVIAIEAPHNTNAVLGVYNGAAVDALLAITYGAGQCAFIANAGATYQIALDSKTEFLTNATLLIAVSDVEITSPTSGFVFYTPASVTVQALRTGPQRQLTRASLLANGVSMGDLPLDTLAGSYAFPDSGYYSLRVAATDDHGLVTHSEAVPISVRPANDDFEAAQVLSGRNLALHVSNSAATRQVTGSGFPWDPRIGEPIWFDNQGGHSIWYRWTAPNDGLCVISGAGTDFALLFFVCLGTSVNSLSVVAANALAAPGAAAQFDAVAGTTYFISVDGYFGEEGTLDWMLHLAPYNDNFSSRRLLTGLSAEFQDSHSGATLEPGESALAPALADSSLWFTWQAPLAGEVTLTAAGTNGLALGVFTGSSFGNLVQVATNTGGWANAPTLRFTAQSAVNYQIAVFGQGADAGSFLFQLALQGLHLVSPLPNTVLPAPAILPLQAQLGVPGETLKEVTYLVNGAVIGTVTNPPFTLYWPAPSAATYTLIARGMATDDVEYQSRPTTCLIYSGKQMPRPQVFSGVQSDTSYVINSVGALHLFGAQPNQFGRTAATPASTPFLASWPLGVTGWKEISGGWAISSSGKLYQDGQALVPFPPGVTEWKKISRGFENTVAVLGNDGNIYLNGTSKMEIPQPPGGWRNLGASFASVNNVILALGEDNEAYLISVSNWQWVSSLLPRPAGVTGFKSIAQAALFSVLLTDKDDLYTYGMYDVTGTIGVGGWNPVPRPAGVNRWVDFAVGGFHVLAIGDNAQLYACGRNWEHQLGLGQDQNPRGIPALVTPPAGVTGWSAVAAGQWHSLAIGNDCSLYAWGDNSVGQAGQPASPPLSRPIRVGSLEALCGTPVLFTDGNTSRLPDGSFRLEFNSDLNRSYLIQYSDDLQTWKNATPALTGTGAFVEWIDDGPPKTDQHPASVAGRSYRVVYAP